MKLFINSGELPSFHRKTFEFAWHDTITGNFLTFNGSSVWTKWNDFVEDFKINPQGYELEKLEKVFDTFVLWL